MIAARDYVILVGRTIGDLRIEGILRYELQRPVYSCCCLRCGAVGVPVHHTKFINGTAHCISSSHTSVTPTKSGTSRASTVGIGPTGSARAQADPDRRSLHIAEQKQAERERQAQIAEQQRQADRDTANEAWRTQVRSEHARYVHHAVHVWQQPQKNLPTLETWFALGDYQRGRLLEKIQKEQ